jgi:hypothetical protein
LLALKLAPFRFFVAGLPQSFVIVDWTRGRQKACFEAWPKLDLQSLCGEIKRVLPAFGYVITRDTLHLSSSAQSPALPSITQHGAVIPSPAPIDITSGSYDSLGTAGQLPRFVTSLPSDLEHIQLQRMQQTGRPTGPSSSGAIGY